MSFLRSHIVLMFVYALATAVFFSALWKRDRDEQRRFFILVFVSLFVGGVAAAWLMYPLPIR